MTTSQRVVRKSLGGEEDLLFGEGTVTQTRNNQDYTITKVRNARPVNSLEELNALDPLQFPKARLYQDDTVIDYSYDGSAWVALPSSPVATVAAMKELNLPAGALVETKGYYTAGDGGHARYLIQTSEEYGGTPDGTEDFYIGGATANVAKRLIASPEIITGESRPLRHFGKLTESNHSDVLSTAINAAVADGFKLFVPSNEDLNLASWTTPVLSGELDIEFQDGLNINSDSAVDFLETSRTLRSKGFATLDGFAKGLSFKNIVDNVELYVHGLRGKNMETLINMRYSDNNGAGSLFKAVIEDIYAQDMTSWGVDISPETFGDITFLRPRFKNCQTRFIGIGNNATGENYSTNQIVRVLYMIADGLQEQGGFTELQGLYITGCQNAYVLNPDIRNLDHTASAKDSEGIYIKAANTTIQSPRLLNAGGNQGMLVVKGSGVGTEVKSTANITDAVIESTTPTTLPTCPLYVQADDVHMDGTLRGNFTRPIQCNQSVAIERLDLDVKFETCIADRLIQITPNVVTADVSVKASNINVLFQDRPVAMAVVGATDPADQGKQISRNIYMRNGEFVDFKNSGGTVAGTLLEVDQGSDTSAQYGKISARNNECGNLTFSVRGVSGTVDTLISEGNDLTGGTAGLSQGSVSVTKLINDNFS